MIRAFFRTKEWFWWAYGGGLFLLGSLYAQVHMSVLFNKWYGGFYDMLQKATDHSVAEFWAGLTHFMYIAIPYVASPNASMNSKRIWIKIAGNIPKKETSK